MEISDGQRILAGLLAFMMHICLVVASPGEPQPVYATLTVQAPDTVAEKGGMDDKTASGPDKNDPRTPRPKQPITPTPPRPVR